MTIPTYNDVLASAKRIHGFAVRTPLLYSPALSERFDARIYLKSENLQRTGSFKFRGAFNALCQIPEADRTRGVLAISSGNHGQGVAEAARLLGIQATIIMPADAPEVKITRTRDSGAELIFYDRASADRDQITKEQLQHSGAVLIHPFNNADVIAGQGTIGLEIADELSSLGEVLDILLVCTGGGGLTAGLALACCERYPHVQMFCVEPDGFDDYRRSLLSGSIVGNDATTGSICDAILTPAPGIIGFSINKDRLKCGLSVSDLDVLRAIRFVFEKHRMLAEPGGAVALAAILSGQLEAQVGSISGKTIVATVSGGNVDQAVLLQALQTA